MITVLYVDDEPALLDIAKRFLEKNSEFKVYTALSAKEGLEIITTKKVQAIVSDFQMPGMDGMAFLKEIRKTSAVPFIMFTGRGSEMVAMEATNNGADYYIQKGADPRALFSELTYKLRLAVSDRKTETEEQRMKKTIRTLIDKTYGAVIIHSPDGKIYDVNDKMLDLFQLTRPEALKLSISDLSGPDAPEQKRSEIIKTVLSGEDQFLVWEAKRPHDNTLFKVEKFITRINFGQNFFLLCNIRDISGREKIEEIQAATNFALNHCPQGIICCDADSRIIFINSTWTNRLKSRSPELIGQFLSIIDPSLTIEAWLNIVEKSNLKDGLLVKRTHLDATGTEIPVELTILQYHHEGKLFICIYVRELLEE